MKLKDIKTIKNHSTANKFIEDKKLQQKLNLE
jgi:hypothetical protein